MKKLFKDKRLLAVIGGVATLVLVITLVYSLSRGTDSPPIDSTSEPPISELDTDIIIELPENSETSDIPDESAVDEIPDDGIGLKPDESTSVDSGTSTKGEKAQDTAPPAKETNPPKNTDSSNSGGIQIGGGENDPVTYNCGHTNHHCDGPETHAYIQSLEHEGCLYCGSHSCPSFYAVDEWGNTCYTPNKCPQYDVKKDAVEYCQVCGKKNGNGGNDTCQKWIIDFTCPNCGKLVKANQCHTH